MSTTSAPDFVDSPTLRWVADHHDEEITYAKKQIARLGSDPKVASTVGYWRVVGIVHKRMRAEFRRLATRIEKGQQ